MRTSTLTLLLLTLGIGVGCDDSRTIDGTDNNPNDPTLGSANTALRRIAPADYADGVSALAGAHRPSPREISNTVHAQSESRPNPLHASDFIWQWGQFLDHDIDLTPEQEPHEPAPIPVPLGDPHFDPFFTGTATIPFSRSLHDPTTGTGPGNPREHVNVLTTFIDASHVYGSDPARAAALRTLDGTGRLKTSPGDLLPFNTAGLPNGGGPDPSLFVAGDIRANEQVALTVMHTLFVREHNRIVGIVNAFSFQHLSGDELYESGRHWVGGLMQAITYREYLPALLGPYAPSVHSTYDSSVDPRIATEFSTALFRLGHSQLSSTLLRLDRFNQPISERHLPLDEAFFAPDEVSSVGIEPYLRGLARQRAQELDVFVIDAVRNFLFGPPGAGGLDLPSLNIQRGRDHGLPSYNGMRVAVGLPAAADYSDISSDPLVRQRLEAAYGPGNVDDVDLWTGALAEDRLFGAHVGPLIATVLVRQFVALRDGDRFWYRNHLHPTVVNLIERTSLSDVIKANTGIGFELPSNVFRVP